MYNIMFYKTILYYKTRTSKQFPLLVTERYCSSETEAISQKDSGDDCKTCMMDGCTHRSILLPLERTMSVQNTEPNTIENCYICLQTQC